MLRGERVVLRPIEKRDVDYFLKWFNDPEVTRFLNFHMPATREGEEKWINEINLSDSSAVFMVEVRKGKKTIPIGTCGLHNILAKDRRATFGIVIGDKRYWENGYGSEAAEILLQYGFESLNLHRISSSVIAYNTRSLKMHLRLGFQREGTSRKAFFKENKYHDEIILGILRSDWEKEKKKKQ